MISIIIDEMNKRQKITNEYVKCLVEAKGWELLNSNYKNPKSILQIKCDKKHIFSTSYNSFAGSKGCPVCAKNKTHTYEEIKAAVEKKNWVLLDKEIKNTLQKINCICDKGHHISVQWQNIRDNQRCAACCGNQKYTIEYVREVLKNKNWELLSNEYISNQGKLICKCNNDHIIETSFSRIVQNIGCKYCVGGGRFEFDFIKKYIENYGFKILSDSYLNAGTKLKLQCPKGHIIDMSFRTFKNNHKAGICPICSIRYSEKTILKFLNEHTKYEWKSVFPSWLKYKKRNCQIDAYCEELKVGIEIQGRQHFEFPNYWHKTKRDFIDQQLRDQFKKDKCKELKVKLLEIKTFEFYKNTDKMLEALLKLLLDNSII